MLLLGLARDEQADRRPSLGRASGWRWALAPDAAHALAEALSGGR